MLFHNTSAFDTLPFISKIRKSLGHSSNSDRTWETLVQKMPSCEDEHNRRLQTIRNRNHAEGEALLDELIQAAGPLNLNVIPKPDIASVGAAIAEIVREKSPEWGTQKSVVAWQHPLIQKLNLSETLAKQGVPVYYTAFGKNHGDPRSEIQEREKLWEQVIASYIGITAADFCIAETATLVMKTRQGQARSVSLVPSVHIAVIESGQIIASLKELYTLLKWDPEQRAEGLSNCMTFISGPSKTADIEATLVHGAHGPRELYLFVLCEAARYYLTSMILTGETCEVFKTSQVFGGQTRHDHCGEVLHGLGIRKRRGLEDKSLSYLQFL